MWIAEEAVGGCALEAKSADKLYYVNHLARVAQVRQPTSSRVSGKSSLRFGRCSKRVHPSYPRDNHPINGIDFNQAKAFCKFLDASLPTEAQWEKAARGGCEAGQTEDACKAAARLYPWGAEYPKCTLAVMYGTDPKTNAVGFGCGTGYTNPVGTKAAGNSPYGVADMAGNVQEWVQDWFDANYYSKSPADDPLGPVSGSGRVSRGGDLNDQGNQLRVTRRESNSESDVSFDTGVRCVHDPIK